MTNIVIVDRETESQLNFKVAGDSSSLDVTNSGASTRYCSMLANRVCDTLNSVEMKTEMGTDTWIRFHPEGTEPAPIAMPSLASRSVAINMKDPYSENAMPVKAVAPIGSNIYSKPTDSAMLISLAVEKYDADCDGFITDLSLQQEAQQVFLQLDREITTQIMEELERSDSTGTKYFTNMKLPKLPVGNISTVFDTLEGGMYGAVAKLKQFGTSIEDFIFGVTPSIYRVLERMSRRAGHSTIEDFMGTNVYQYYVNQPIDSGKDAVFVVPKTVCAVSFREATDGTVFTPSVTRMPSKQSTVIEFKAVCDLLVDGFTEVKADVDGELVKADIKLPLVIKVTFDDEEVTV
ncbi:MAG: hypothetical protein ACRC53_01360 [Plesiomonas sp.]|uniref:hypothetical protein n=1 Tax=Plesiomonas sp. TaxID=2486279 RepID=UPI003F2C0D45